MIISVRKYHAKSVSQLAWELFVPKSVSSVARQQTVTTFCESFHICHRSVTYRTQHVSSVARCTGLRYVAKRFVSVRDIVERTAHNTYRQ
jgi:hypothetical protein